MAVATIPDLPGSATLAMEAGHRCLALGEVCRELAAAVADLPGGPDDPAAPALRARRAAAAAKAREAYHAFDLAMWDLRVEDRAEWTRLTRWFRAETPPAGVDVWRRDPC